MMRWYPRPRLAASVLAFLLTASLASPALASPFEGTGPRGAGPWASLAASATRVSEFVLQAWTALRGTLGEKETEAPPPPAEVSTEDGDRAATVDPDGAP